MAYREITLITIASVITAVKTEETYKASIFIDGLSKHEVLQVGSDLRKIGVRTRKVRGVKDENEPCIRLADAMAGFIREYFEGAAWTQPLYRLGVAQRTLRKV